MTVELIPEPPPGAEVTTTAHVWRRGTLDEIWRGCYACDPRTPESWSWEVIVNDCYDDVITVRMPDDEPET